MTTVDDRRSSPFTAPDVGLAAEEYARERREDEHRRLVWRQEAHERWMRDAEEAVRRLLNLKAAHYVPVSMTVEATDEQLAGTRAGGTVEVRVGTLRLVVRPSCTDGNGLPGVWEWPVRATLPCLTGVGPHLHDSVVLFSLADLGRFAAAMAEGPCPCAGGHHPMVDPPGDDECPDLSAYNEEGGAP